MPLSPAFRVSHTQSRVGKRQKVCFPQSDRKVRDGLSKRPRVINVFAFGPKEPPCICSSSRRVEKREKVPMQKECLPGYKASRHDGHA